MVTNKTTKIYPQNVITRRILSVQLWLLLNPINFLFSFVYLQNALQIAMFSSKAMMGSTMTPWPICETMSTNPIVTLSCTTENGGSVNEGRPGGM